MIDFELIITLFLIFLNILIVIYSFKKKDNNNLESNKCDKFVKKMTNLPILIIKIVVFLSIILSFIIFFVPLLESSRIGFFKDLLEFILDFTFFHLVIYLICSLFSKKYNFIKISVSYCIIKLTQIIINLSLPLLS